MKQCIIYYFSGTGNTEYACKKLSEELQKHFFDVKMTKIEDLKNKISVDCDVIGIAYPIHGFNAPKIIDEFCDMIPDGNGKKYFIVKTSGEPLGLNDASSMFFTKTLSLKKYEFTGEYHYVMPYNIIFRHSEDMVSLMINTLKKNIVRDAIDIAECKPKEPKYPLGAKIAASIVRIEHPAIKMIGKGFSVNKKDCVGCNKCVMNCPTENISVVNGKYEFGNECLGCMRCAFNCPKNAINIGILNSWKVNGKYDFEHVAASENPEIIRYCHNSYINYFYGKQSDL